jgi:hypothetical protein
MPFLSVPPSETHIEAFRHPTSTNAPHDLIAPLRLNVDHPGYVANLLQHLPRITVAQYTGKSRIHPQKPSRKRALEHSDSKVVKYILIIVGIASSRAFTKAAALIPQYGVHEAPPSTIEAIGVYVDRDALSPPAPHKPRTTHAPAGARSTQGGSQLFPREPALDIGYRQTQQLLAAIAQQLARRGVYVHDAPVQVVDQECVHRRLEGPETSVFTLLQFREAAFELVNALTQSVFGSGSIHHSIKKSHPFVLHDPVIYV